MSTYDAEWARYQGLVDRATQRAITLTHFGPAVLTAAAAPFLAMAVSKLGVWGLVVFVPAAIVLYGGTAVAIGVTVKVWHGRRLSQLGVQHLAATRHLTGGSADGAADPR